MAGWSRRRCPLCGTAAVTHCRSPYCPWWRCPREACRSVISYRRGLGMQRLPGDALKPFTFPPVVPPG